MVVYKKLIFGNYIMFIIIILLVIVMNNIKTQRKIKQILNKQRLIPIYVDKTYKRHLVEWCSICNKFYINSNTKYSCKLCCREEIKYFDMKDSNNKIFYYHDMYIEKNVE